MDLITLSMPVYNVEKYVEKALLSALNQTYENIEYIIVDDKGKDNSMTIVKKIVSEHQRGKQVKIIEHPVNVGLGATRNTAIKQAKGEYLFFMDSDDEITPDCIRKLYEEIQKNDVDIVFGSHNEIRGLDIISSEKNSIIVKDKERIVLSYFDKNFPTPLWNKLYKVSFLRLNHIKCVPYQTIEDNYFTFQVQLHVQAYSIIPDITYFHYILNDSITNGGKGNEGMFIQFCQIFIDMSDFLQKSSLEPQLKRKVKRRLFKRRFKFAELALESSCNAQHHISEYLNPQFLKDKDTLRSIFLFFAYIISIMPLSIKKIGLSIHSKMTKKI